MGVIGTFCQLCGLPAQHDHYVRAPGVQMMKIYRGDQPKGGHDFEPEDRVFSFGPEHDWLLRAVAIPHDESLGPPQHGVCSDGVLEDGSDDAPFVADGTEDRYVFHEVCWEALGRPNDLASFTLSRGTFDWALVEPFQQQLFEIVALRDQGKAHMLVEPSREPRTRARIDRMVAMARVPIPELGNDVASILRLDRAWSGLLRTNEDGDARAILQYRTDAQPDFDRTGYPTLFWLVKPWTEDDALPTGPQMAPFDDFGRALKEAVEKDGDAVLVIAVAARGQVQYLVYAKDEATTRARIDALPGRNEPLPLEYTCEADPAWAQYFEQMWPAR